MAPTQSDASAMETSGGEDAQLEDHAEGVVQSMHALTEGVLQRMHVRNGAGPPPAAPQHPTCAPVSHSCRCLGSGVFFRATAVLAQLLIIETTNNRNQTIEILWTAPALTSPAAPAKPYIAFPDFTCTHFTCFNCRA